MFISKIEAVRLLKASNYKVYGTGKSRNGLTHKDYRTWNWPAYMNSDDKFYLYKNIIIWKQNFNLGTTYIVEICS